MLDTEVCILFGASVSNYMESSTDWLNIERPTLSHPLILSGSSGPSVICDADDRPAPHNIDASGYADPQPLAE